MITQRLKLDPGQPLSEDLKEKLTNINKEYSKNKNFPEYVKKLEKLFGISGEQDVTSEMKLFMAGFCEGEASINISLKKKSEARFGVVLDPEFSITQHFNGFKTLYLALKIFNTGRIRFKDRSLATLVFIIDNRENLEKKVIPFYRNFVVPYCSTEKIRRLDLFEQLILCFNDNKHQNLQSFIEEMLPIWDKMLGSQQQKVRSSRSEQVNESFPNIAAAVEFMLVANKNKAVPLL